MAKRALGVICFFVVIAFVISTISVPAIGWAQAKAPAKTVDLNSASGKELESLPGVGPATAKKIIANRPYKSADELTKAGLSKKAIEKLRPMVTAGPATAAPAASQPAMKGPAAPSAKTPAAAGKTAGAEKAAPAKLAPGQKININTAPKEQLEALPGIGPVKAQAIIDGRPYKTPEDIMKVKGIKQGTYNKIKNNITTQ